jgi:hypothetical protein
MSLDLVKHLHVYFLPEKARKDLFFERKKELCNHILRFYTPARKLELYDFTMDRIEALSLKHAISPEHQAKIAVEPEHRSVPGFAIERS